MIYKYPPNFNLNNFPPSGFYSTPPHPTIRLCNAVVARYEEEGSPFPTCAAANGS